MNALQHSLSLSALTTRVTIFSREVPFLELSLPAGCQLVGGTGCRLEILQGILWLTDARQEDLWLYGGDSTQLKRSALASTEADTVLRLHANKTTTPDVMICPIRRQVRLLASRTPLDAIFSRLVHGQCWLLLT